MSRSFSCNDGDVVVLSGLREFTAVLNVPGLSWTPFNDRISRVMPRVVPDQREKFENDELFRKMSRESEVSVIDRLLGYMRRMQS